MKKVTLIKSSTDGTSESIVGTTDGKDYTVRSRYWVASDGMFIREWSNHEYIFEDPNNFKHLEVHVGDRVLKVVGHCVEIREVYAHNKNGVRIMSFVESYEYGGDDK